MTREVGRVVGRKVGRGVGRVAGKRMDKFAGCDMGLGIGRRVERDGEGWRGMMGKEDGG